MRKFKKLSFHATALLLGMSLILCVPGAANAGEDETTYHVPVVVANFFPLKESNINIDVTGDWGKSLAFTRAKTDSLSKEIVKTLENGSKYRFYKNPEAEPSLKYSIVKIFEFLEPLPTVKKAFRKVPYTDYNAIMKKIDARYWVEERGVKEIWIWGYHGGVVHLWESNMAGPFGDVSNSNRDPDDLPVFAHTYTVYHYNYQRGQSEAIEDHIHQIEAVLNFIDDRDNTPKNKWDKLLFWGKFVGSDRTHKIIRPGCGWAHYPPNGERDYDWANPRYVETDLEDWKPDGSGQKKRMNCERWNCNSLDWFTLWMQSIPGKENQLSYQGKPLTNWWIFIGDFDAAMKQGLKLINK
ncbi:hypothetical protein JXJ21_17020 [candidate division KSB1 bacterium]|nr:hypothetical protein [candidate division KSB1 bacterium]